MSLAKVYVNFRLQLSILGSVRGRPQKLSKTPVTQVINCSLCYRMESGTGAPSLGPKGSLKPLRDWGWYFHVRMKSTPKVNCLLLRPRR